MIHSSPLRCSPASGCDTKSDANPTIVISHFMSFSCGRPHAAAPGEQRIKRNNFRQSSLYKLRNSPAVWFLIPVRVGAAFRRLILSSRARDGLLEDKASGANAAWNGVQTARRNPTTRPGTKAGTCADGDRNARAGGRVQRVVSVTRETKKPPHGEA